MKKNINNKDTYKYKFSVIIPIYNVEKYLDETINSILKQTIGFEKNIQLILVNDGSTDKSEDICLKYKDKYPNNIVYIKQKNSGVAVARNAGMKLVEGKYLNFIDGDDKWEPDAFEKGYNILEKNPKVNMAAYRVKFFEGSNKYHTLDFMFNDGDKIVNLNNEYNYIKLQSCSIIIRFSSLKPYVFDKNLKIAEDIKFVTEFILDNPIIAIISSCCYLYRKRSDESSTIQTSISKKTWYNDTPKLCYKYLFDLSIKKYGKLHPYVQAVVLYDLQWRLFKEPKAGVLTKNEKKAYIETINDLISSIDDNVIVDSPFFNSNMKIKILSYKYRNNLKKLNDIVSTYNMKEISIKLSNIIINNNELSMFLVIQDLDYLKNVYLVYNNKEYPLKKYVLDSNNGNIKTVDENVNLKNKGLSINLKLDKSGDFYFAYKNKSKLSKLNVVFSAIVPFTKKYTSLYLKTDDYYFFYDKSKEVFSVKRKKCINGLILKSKFYFKLLISKKIKESIIRILSRIYKCFTKGEIWIVSDRLNVAGDNGEAFFDYLVNNKKGPKHKYFLISKSSADYNKLLSKYGKKLITSESLKYKLLFLNASKIISAQADDYVINPFNKNKLYRDKYNFKFIFLQHGVTKDDLSPWLNINNKKIDLFITSSSEEQKSILDCNYNYSKNIIKVTGLARYDLLKDSSKDNKIILLMPTWRKNLVSQLDIKTGLRVYDKNFKETQYFKFYNSLINNQRLLKKLKETGYIIKFVPHNNMYQQINDFKANEFVHIETDRISYKEEFNNANLLITDYSSVFFDFAYLRKPVIFSQFDTEEFFKNQIYDKGYFDYKKHGFGPVCGDIESVVDKIIEYIDNDCILKEKYRKRINTFFKYDDNNNCERIYNEIMKMK